MSFLIAYEQNSSKTPEPGFLRGDMIFKKSYPGKRGMKKSPRVSVFILTFMFLQRSFKMWEGKLSAIKEEGGFSRKERGKVPDPNGR